jgi:hypothetical protein
MKVRDLTVSESLNMKGVREFNHLRVANLDDFLARYPNNLDYYASPFKILSDLEEAVKYENNPETTVLIAYKDDGDVIFRLEGIEEKNGLRIVQYSFDTFIS